MGCSVIQRGIITNATVFIGNGISTSFDDIKIEQAAVDDFIFCAYRDDGEDPPFLAGRMELGNQIDTLDGGPEDFGGGGDTWYEIEIGSGSEIVNVPANQLLPVYPPVGGWADVAAKDLTTSMYVVVINFAMGNDITQQQITGVASSTSTTKIHHPIFDYPLESLYYAAADSAHSGDYGILVATCLGDF